MRINRWTKPVLACLLTAFFFPSSFQETVYTSAASEPTVYMNPPQASARVGESASINISIVDATDIYAWEFFLKWEPYSVFNYVDSFNVIITEGDFLKRGGQTFMARKIELPPIGQMQVGCLLIGKISGVNGSGTLAKLTFQVREEGNAKLSLQDTKLLDSSLKLLAHKTQDGSFTGEPAAPGISYLLYVGVGIGICVVTIVLIAYIVSKRIRKDHNQSPK